jgi:Protein of unknown function (DUF3352)
MKFRSFLSILIAGVVTALLIGLAGLFWLTSHNPLTLLNGSGTTSPAAAMFVSKQAPAMVSLLANPERLEAFRLAIARPAQRKHARKELQALRQSLISGLGLDYTQDIKPWIGDEITLAVTTSDVDRDATNGRQPGYLLAIATRKPALSREFLQAFWQKRAIAGSNLVFEQYSGVKIISGAVEPLPSKAVTHPEDADAPRAELASAAVGDQFILFANYPKVLRDAINNVQAASLNLSTSSSYQRALKSLPDRQIGLVFANLPQLFTWLDDGTENAPLADADARLYESLVATLNLDPRGLAAETALLPVVGKTLFPTQPALNGPIDALKFIPAASPFSASGENLPQLMSQVQAGVAGYERLEALVRQPIMALKSEWLNPTGSEVASDDWVTDMLRLGEGQYSLAMLPRPDKTSADWLFIAQRSPALDEAITRMNQLGQQNGLSVGQLTLGDREAYAWTKLSTAAQRARKRRGGDRDVLAVQAEVQGIHTHVDGYELFATSVDAINQALQAPENSLAKSAEFKQAIAPIESRNDGYLYLDWPSLRGIVSQQVPLVGLVEAIGKPLFDHVRSFTVSSYGNEKTVRRGTVFVQLRD